MYLAFKWLIFLVLLMWILLCAKDSLSNEKSDQSTFRSDPTVFEYNLKGIKSGNYQRQSMVLLNYLMFIAGALAVILYNKKTEIILCAQHHIEKIQFRENAKKAILCFKKTAIYLGFTMLKKGKCWWENSWNRFLRFEGLRKIIFNDFNDMQYEDESRKERNIILLKRLREVGQERNKLGRLLVIAVQENKKMRLQRQFEKISKDRLLQQIQETQNQINEQKLKQTSFQQLQLLTHQENMYLKNRLKRVVEDKQEAEANLMKLLRRISQSTDNNLKSYCTSFLMKTKENILTKNPVVSTLSNKCLEPGSSISKKSFTADDDDDSNISPTSTSKRESGENDLFVGFPEVSEPKPKMRGLPGEYVWTIKDKDGIIERLYEYDYGYNFDNGDMIRRIREYSVYHDSDCLLDFAGTRSSTTIVRETSPSPSVFNMPNRKFLTGSPAFQQFLQANNTLQLSASRQPSPPLLCG